MAQPPQGEPDVFARQLAKKTPRKRSRASIYLGRTAICLAAIAIAVLCTQWGRDSIPTTGLILKAMVSPDRDNVLFNTVGQDRVNILVVGEDYNWKPAMVLNPHTGKKAPFREPDLHSAPRSDSMIVVSLDRGTHALRVLSLPRDAEVTYRDLDGDLHHAQKLNSVYAEGGTDQSNRQKLLRQVLASELGIRTDRFIALRPDGFTKLVNMVGGVDVNVDGALKLDKRTGKLYRGHIHYTDHWGEWSVDLDPGMQHLDGDQAHGYVRFREDREGDPGRIRRQQAVTKALVKALKQTPYYNIPSRVAQMRRELMTDMSEEELISFGLFARSLGDSSKVQPVTLFGIFAPDGSDIILNKPKNIKLLDALLGKSFDPDHFLVHSPSTRGDDIGPTNNAGPEVRALLKEAGLLDQQERSEKTSAVFNAPVRMGGPDSERHHGDVSLSPHVFGEAGISATPRRDGAAPTATEGAEGADATPTEAAISRSGAHRRHRRHSLDSASTPGSSSGSSSSPSPSSSSSSDSAAATPDGSASTSDSPVPRPEN